MISRVERQILAALLEGGPRTWSQLVERQDGTLGELDAALRALEERRLIGTEAGAIAPTARARAELARWTRAPLLALGCDRCDGKGYRVDASDPLRARLAALLAGRPAPNLDYDQGAIGPDDLLLRAAFMRDRGDLHDR